jgi:hypothetical protein
LGIFLDSFRAKASLHVFLHVELNELL